jgi:hypothetical protein
VRDGLADLEVLELGHGLVEGQVEDVVGIALLDLVAVLLETLNIAGATRSYPSISPLTRACGGRWAPR